MQQGANVALRGVYIKRRVEVLNATGQLSLCTLLHKYLGTIHVAWLPPLEGGLLVGSTPTAQTKRSKVAELVDADPHRWGWSGSLLRLPETVGCPVQVRLLSQSVLFRAVEQEVSSVVCKTIAIRLCKFDSYLYDILTCSVVATHVTLTHVSLVRVQTGQLRQ